jgi:FKBP-type peptidyl-prolyl cis-trans isomerase
MRKTVFSLAMAAALMLWAAVAMADALADGMAFLKLNASKPAVHSTSSGLQYKVIKEGKGPKPAPGSVVTVHYRGTLINGQEFDSSYKRGEPATFPLDRVIRGWQEAVPMMQTGAKWEIYVPSELAYGGRQMGAMIPANSTLIFEIELISIGQ